MSENQSPDQDLKEEFRTLGQNLVEALRASWESPERKRIQEEITIGLNDLAATLKEEVEEFQESPTGQRLRTEVDDFQQRVRSGEVESKFRTELLNVLHLVNQELQKVSGSWKAQREPEKPEAQVDESGSETPGGG